MVFNCFCWERSRGPAEALSFFPSLNSHLSNALAQTLLSSEIALITFHFPLKDQNISESFCTYDFPHIKDFLKIQSLKRYDFRN